MAKKRKSERQEVDLGTRAIITTSKKLRIPLKDISNETNVPTSTTCDICKHAEACARLTKLPIYHEDNQHSFYRSGQPQALTEAQKNILVLHIISSKEQRMKTWPIIAAELEFNIS